MPHIKIILPNNAQQGTPCKDNQTITNLCINTYLCSSIYVLMGSYGIRDNRDSII